MGFFVLSKEWGFEFKARVSEIRVKRIRVNQGVSVPVIMQNMEEAPFAPELKLWQI